MDPRPLFVRTILLLKPSERLLRSRRMPGVMVITTGRPDDDVNPQQRQEVQFQRQRHVFEADDFDDQKMRRHHLQIH